MEKEILEKIRDILRVMNPIRVESLALQLDIGLNSLNELLNNYIEKNLLNVKIINDSIFSPTSETMNIENLLPFKKAHKSRGKWYCNACEKEFDHLHFNYKDLKDKYKDFYDFDVLTSLNDLSIFESIFSDNGLCPFCQSTDIEKI